MTSENNTRALRGGGFATLAVGLVLCVACMGCSTLHDPSETVLEPDTAPLADPALRYRIGVLPVVVPDELRTTADDINSAGSHRRWEYVPTPEWCRSTAEEITDAMRQMNCAERVEFIPGAEGRRLESILDEAWADGLDLVARPVLRKRRCDHVRSNDGHVAALIIWLVIFHALTWGIADETFSSDTVLGVEFYSTGRTELTPVAAREVAGHVEHDLDDFQQGFNFFNAFITPSGLSPGHWEDIGHNLLPLSRRECQREFVRLASEPGGFAADLQNAGDDLSKTLALLVGVLPEGDVAPRYAIQNAQRLRETLTATMDPPACLDRGVRLLSGVDATADGVADAIDSFLYPLARPDDRIVLYLGAPGIIDANGDGWLLLADSDPEDPTGTGLAIRELADLLGSLPADVAVFASVNWMDTTPVGTEPVGTAPSPWRALTGLPNVVLLEAQPAGTEGQLVEIDSAQAGLFVDRVIASMISAGTDRDRDGRITFTEIASAVTDPIKEYSRILGQPQTPALAGPESLRSATWFRAPNAAGQPSIRDNQ